MASEEEPEAAAATEEVIDVEETQQQEPVYVRPLRPEDIPPLFVVAPDETLEKAHECISKYGITGSHRLSDVAHN